MLDGNEKDIFIGSTKTDIIIIFISSRETAHNIHDRQIQINNSEKLWLEIKLH